MLLSGTAHDGRELKQLRPALPLRHHSRGLKLRTGYEKLFQNLAQLSETRNSIGFFFRIVAHCQHPFLRENG